MTAAVRKKPNRRRQTPKTEQQQQQKYRWAEFVGLVDGNDGNAHRMWVSSIVCSM